MHWPQVEAYLQKNDRCILPKGCTEQYAYLSLLINSIRADKVTNGAVDGYHERSAKEVKVAVQETRSLLEN